MRREPITRHIHSSFVRNLERGLMPGGAGRSGTMRLSTGQALQDSGRSHGAFRRAALMAGALLLSLSGPALAAEQPLDADGLKKLIAGKRVYLATPLGGEIPLYYKQDGHVDGSGQAVGLGRWLKPTDSGRWWISGNRLCQQWQTWYNGDRMCFTVISLGGNKIRWNRDNGETGIARVEN
jgi:hypothetical protein